MHQKQRTFHVVFIGAIRGLTKKAIPWLLGELGMAFGCASDMRVLWVASLFTPYSKDAPICILGGLTFQYSGSRWGLEKVVREKE